MGVGEWGGGDSEAMRLGPSTASCPGGTRNGRRLCIRHSQLGTEWSFWFAFPPGGGVQKEGAWPEADHGKELMGARSSLQEVTLQCG